MNRVYLDSMFFIYFLESTPGFGRKARELLMQMNRRGDRLCTSAFTIGEVLTGPRKSGSSSGVEVVNRYFRSGEVEVLPLTLEGADRYSAIRATHRVSQPDAIHLATAATAGVELFATNDRELLKLKLPGIRFMMDMDGKVY